MTLVDMPSTRRRVGLKVARNNLVRNQISRQDPASLSASAKSSRSFVCICTRCDVNYRPDEASVWRSIPAQLSSGAQHRRPAVPPATFLCPYVAWRLWHDCLMWP